MARARQRPIGFSLSLASTLTLGVAVVMAAIGAERAQGADEARKVQTPNSQDLGAMLDAVARYQHGGERKPLHALQQLVVYANSLGGNDAAGFRSGLADRMAALLSSPSATPAAKAFVCGQLAMIATEKQAPALASLLTDKGVADAALRTLQQIPGSTVDRILRDALGTEEATLKIGVVNAIGERRDQAAAESLSAMLAGADQALACSAASALGKIGGDAAAEALQKALGNASGALRVEVVNACLACADQMLAEGRRDAAAGLYGRLSMPGEAEQTRMAAFRGVVLSNSTNGVRAVCGALLSGDPALEAMAIQLLPEITGPAATEQFAECLGKAPGPVQTLLLGALAVRGDAAVRGAVEALVASADPAVRLAALNALGTLGDETTAKTLFDRALTAAGTDEGQAARRSLVRLRGERIDEVLADSFAQGNGSAKAELIRILAARRAVRAIPDLEKATEDPDAMVRRESWKALAELARGQDVDALLDLHVRVRADERDEAEKAVMEVLKRSDRAGVQAVLQKLDAVGTPEAQSSLIRIVSAVGDDCGLPALRKAIQSGDAAMRDAAVRGLAAWPTAAPLEDLVNLARNASESVHRVLALRAALRLASKAEGRTPEQTTALVTELMQLARDTTERKAVLAELGRCPTLDALHLAQKYLADSELATEAGVAVIQIASAIRDAQRDEVLTALQPLLAGNRDAAVAGRAGKVLKDILKPVNLALGATASSPDGLNSDGSSGGDQAAIDGNPATYWDEVDGADLYRLQVTFREPTEVSSVNIVWHPYEQHQAKNLDIVCDGKVVAEVREGHARCFENEMFVAFAMVCCTSVELVMPGKNGLVSPAVHEFQIFGRFPPEGVSK